VLSGFEFTEYTFVISADRRELIAIDAGTRPDSARAAYEALKAAVPSLPPLTTVLITHAHWDHVGGHSTFRSLNPAVRFIGRSNYQDELAIDAMANPAGLREFFGDRFRLDDVLSYKPDVTVEYNFYQKPAGAPEKFFNKTNPQALNAQTLPPNFDLAAGHQLQSGQAVPLASFPEGDYRLEIKVTDKIANKTLTREINFTVSPT